MMKPAATVLTAMAAIALLASVPAAAASSAGGDTRLVAQAADTTPKRAKRGAPDITREEYIDRAAKAAARRFDAMDANKDGRLTAQERRDYTKKRREERRARRKKGG